MNVLVTYDSQQRDIEMIAHQIAQATKGQARVSLTPVDDLYAFDLAAADLLVAGGPTQLHGLSTGLHDLFNNVPTLQLEHAQAVTFTSRSNC